MSNRNLEPVSGGDECSSGVYQEFILVLSGLVPKVQSMSLERQFAHGTQYERNNCSSWVGHIYGICIGTWTILSSSLCHQLLAPSCFPVSLPCYIPSSPEFGNPGHSIKPLRINHDWYPGNCSFSSSRLLSDAAFTPNRDMRRRRRGLMRRTQTARPTTHQTTQSSKSGGHPLAREPTTPSPPVFMNHVCFHTCYIWFECEHGSIHLVDRRKF
jgi:hypothetical protein